MRFPDLLRLAFANLRRNRTRSVLTLVGVLIGVGALLALVGYGAGTQQNARSEFNAMELYNTLRVTSRPNPINGFGDLAVRQVATPDTLPEVPVTDSLLGVIGALDGVVAAYPEVIFPVTVQRGDREVIANAEAVPLAFADVPSYRPEVGAFFTTPADTALLIAPTMARRLGFETPEAAIGDTVTLVTATLDMRAMQAMARALSFGLGTLPLREQRHPMRVAGLLDEDDQPLTGFFRVVLPMETALGMRKITFFSTLDLLMRRGSSTEGYAAARVQLTDLDAYPRVRAAIEARGVYVTSFREQFAQLERLFLLMDLALGIIGFIALLVATIGIANTMMMNVMERTREIGVMKAVGGDEGDLQRLFIVESVTLGLVGGLLGLVAGWLVMEGITWGVNAYLSRLGVPYLEPFYVSAPMVFAILGIALAVSLAAGLAPARRAARIEPLAALRST